MELPIQSVGTALEGMGVKGASSATRILTSFSRIGVGLEGILPALSIAGGAVAGLAGAFALANMSTSNAGMQLDNFVAGPLTNIKNGIVSLGGDIQTWLSDRLAQSLVGLVGMLQIGIVGAINAVGSGTITLINTVIDLINAFAQTDMGRLWLKLTGNEGFQAAPIAEWKMLTPDLSWLEVDRGGGRGTMLPERTAEVTAPRGGGGGVAGLTADSLSNIKDLLERFRGENWVSHQRTRTSLVEGPNSISKSFDKLRLDLLLLMRQLPTWIRDAVERAT